jgi:hypothetical protein
MIISLNKETRKLWADKILELTNIGAGALIFGQLVSDKPFSPSLILVGVGIFVTGFFLSLVLLRKN